VNVLPEGYRPVVGFEELYCVSETGIVYRVCKTGRLRPLKPGPNRVGYLHVGLRKERRAHCVDVHRIAALAFLGPRPVGLDIRHINGVKTDNRICNLSYGTRTENMADAKAHGTIKQGVDCHLSRLNETDVLEIRRLYAVGVSIKCIASILDLRGSNVWCVVNGHTWKHVL
jgi:hypothetical protein